MIKLPTLRKIRLFSAPVQGDAIVVAGLGRCGTTLVHDSLCNNGFFPSGFFLKQFDDIDTYFAKHVYKTHDYPPLVLPKNVKLIYLFGNPMNIALSAHHKLNKWGKLHHEHLRSDKFIENDILIRQDSLQLYDHFDAWYKHQGFPFISVRYEALYKQEVLVQLSNYLNFELKLLPFKQRETDWTQYERRDDLFYLYKGLYEKIEAVEDLKIWYCESC